MILLVARILPVGRPPTFGVINLPDGGQRIEMPLRDMRTVQVDLMHDIAVAFEIEEKSN